LRQVSKWSKFASCGRITGNKEVVPGQKSNATWIFSTERAFRL
jgi:hypothetical protein